MVPLTPSKRRPGEPFPLPSDTAQQYQWLLYSQIEAFYARVIAELLVSSSRKGDGSIPWTCFPDITEGKILVSYGLPWAGGESKAWQQESFEVPLSIVLQGREEDVQEIVTYLLKGKQDDDDKTY